MSHPREVVRFLIKDIVTFHNELPLWYVEAAATLGMQ